jgi:1,4-alpha-glucan branching enzyme
MTPTDLDASRVERLLQGREHAPGEWLGLHVHNGTARVAVYLPDAAVVRIAGGPALAATRWPGVFVWHGNAQEVPPHYRLEWRDHGAGQHTLLDPFTFAASLAAHDLYLFNEGNHQRAADFLGAHTVVIDGQPGTRFAVWAPNAERVSVVGDFNMWDGRRHPMNAQGSSGTWSLFVPELGPGARYKFEIRNRVSGTLLLKADPFARANEHRPLTASVISAPSTHVWQDSAWLARRGSRDPLTQPISIYEVHLGSWRRGSDGTFLDYRALAIELVRHVQALGFTHVELLPITEHPFDGSWGYQSLGYFAPTNRFGSADDLRWFVDHCHAHGIGVILDWVPAHFPRDSHGLAHFDGSALYEHADPRLGEHRDWDTLIFNYGRNEVRSFLTSSALYWLREFHFDGLRVDAVASMLYLDYSREPGEWLPNRYGGRENLDAIAWLRELNVVTHRDSPGTIIIAEESTAWPGVSRPTDSGGLGFTLKWNMGWMNDTLSYMALDPVHRAYQHRNLTFGMLYAYSENFVLPLSHDEVVHGKGSLLGKMPGDDWKKFANLRLLLTYQATMPGKKLLFMGGEFAQWGEWDHHRELQWQLLGYAPHRGIFELVAALNRLYRDDAALHVDTHHSGFAWINCDDAATSVLSYQRRSGNDGAIIVLNFTPVPRHQHRIGVPEAGSYREIFNSDSAYFGGSNLGNAGRCHSEAVPHDGFPQSLRVTLPPLAGVIFKRDRNASDTP